MIQCWLASFSQEILGTSCFNIQSRKPFHPVDGSSTFALEKLKNICQNIRRHNVITAWSWDRIFSYHVGFTLHCINNSYPRFLRRDYETWYSVDLSSFREEYWNTSYFNIESRKPFHPVHGSGTFTPEKLKNVCQNIRRHNPICWNVCIWRGS